MRVEVVLGSQNWAAAWLAARLYFTAICIEGNRVMGWYESVIWLISSGTVLVASFDSKQ